MRAFIIHVCVIIFTILSNECDHSCLLSLFDCNFFRFPSAGSVRRNSRYHRSYTSDKPMVPQLLRSGHDSIIRRNVSRSGSMSGGSGKHRNSILNNVCVSPPSPLPIMLTKHNAAASTSSLDISQPDKDKARPTTSGQVTRHCEEHM